MRALPTGPRGHALALGITIVALLGFLILVVEPLVRLYAERADRLAEQTVVADRMERLAAQRASFEARVAQRDNLGAGHRMLDGRTDAVAAAELQNLMQDIANGVGATLSSVESLPVEPGGGDSRRIGIKLSLSASWPVVIEYLNAAEHSATPILIDDLHIHGQPGIQNAEQMLDAGFSVYAYAAAAGAKTP